MAPEMIRTRTAEIWTREDGITQTVILPNAHETLADAKEIVAATVSLNYGKPTSILVDIRGVRSIDREARSYFSGKDNVQTTKALALLVESPASKIIANFFINFNKPVVPTRLFTSEDEAIAWLKTFLE